jgi:tetratricopeptide (TPR) repeat protein
MGRLQYFLNVDDAARRRAALVAMGIGCGVGMFVQSRGQSFKAAAYTAVVLTGIVFTLRVWLYCHAVAKPRILPVNDPAFARRRLIKALATAVIMFGLVIVPVQVEAGVLDRRLRALARNTPLSAEDTAKIANDLNTAQRWRVDLPSATLIEIRDAVKRSALIPPPGQSIPDAANALAEYGQSTNQLDDWHRPDSKQILAALTSGALHMKRGEYDAALPDFTRAIGLAKDNRSLQIEGLKCRAVLYCMGLRRYDDALADAQSAEALGALDLSVIFFVEGVALAHRNNPEDAKRATQLLTLASHMQPIFFTATGPEAMPETWPAYYGNIYSELSIIFFDFNEFDKSREYAQRALRFIPTEQPRITDDLYEIIIVSYLRLGNYEAALKTTNEFAARVGSGEAARWRDLVEFYPQQPAFTLNELMRLMDRE